MHPSLFLSNYALLAEHSEALVDGQGLLVRATVQENRQSLSLQGHGETGQQRMKEGAECGQG